MSERDELAEILAERYHAPHQGVTVLDAAIADAIIAAGYRKPRTITTAEELDAAIYSAFEAGGYLIISDRSARPWIIWSDEDGDEVVNSWPQEEDPKRLTLANITLPATVLHEGNQP